MELFPGILLVKTGLEKRRVEISVAEVKLRGQIVLMTVNSLPESVRLFVFEYVDSVELLEVLLYMRAHCEVACDSHFISSELRSNPQSVFKRMQLLEACGLVVRLESPADVTNETLRYQYKTRSVDMDATIATLAEIYKKKPHRILEVIFSPLKKSRQFADAFLVKQKKETQDG